jgi:DNA-directed RNA polymerase subunit omega
LKAQAVRPVDGGRFQRVNSIDADGLCFVVSVPQSYVREERLLMARVTVEDCLANVDSRFTLVHLAVRRVLQLRHGAPPTLENVKANKEVVLALREIAAGTINSDNIRQIEESRPLLAEPTPQEADMARAELQEILDEVSSYGSSIEYGTSDRYLEEDQPPEGPQAE